MDCQLKYKYTYIDHFAVPEDQEPPVADVTKKGNALHETFEAIIKENLSKDASYKRLQDEIIKQNLTYESIEDPKERQKEFDRVISGLDHWWQFREYLETLGIKNIYAEKEYNEPLAHNGIEKICKSFFDLLIELNDGSWIIVDYKTPKSVDVEKYREQLELYVFVLHSNLVREGLETCSLEEFTEKCKTSVYFPIATVAKKNEGVAARFIPLQYDYAQLSGFIDKLFKEIDTLQKFDFDKNQFQLTVKTKMGVGCQWCPYCGTDSNDGIDGYEGCQVSKDLGLPKRLQAGVKFQKPQPKS